MVSLAWSGVCSQLFVVCWWGMGSGRGVTVPKARRNQDIYMHCVDMTVRPAWPVNKMSHRGCVTWLSNLTCHDATGSVCLKSDLMSWILQKGPFKPFILNCIKTFKSVIMTLTTAPLIIRLIHSYLNTNTNTNTDINNTHVFTTPHTNTNNRTNTTLQTKSRDARKCHRVVGGYVVLRVSFNEHNRIHCVMLNLALSCVSRSCVIIFIY